MQLDTPQKPAIDSVPAKHGEPGRRIVLSPTKINEQSKLRKPHAFGENGPENEKLQVPTPSTPRHHDVSSSKSTPRHRVAVSAIASTPHTPKTPSGKFPAGKSIYNEARKVFARGAHPGPLVGREKERAQLRKFISSHADSKEGSCMYVSGPPGTGKSALVGEICDEVKDRTDIKFTYLNCMSIKRQGDAYNHLVSSLELSDDIFSSAVKDVFISAATSLQGSRTLLVVLDEIDQLLSIDLQTLYTLFSIALQKHPQPSNLILIGIANALDLTDRFLPRLKAHNLRPQLLPFLPYRGPEVASVLSSRARSLLPPDTTASSDFTPLIVPAAVQLISKKVAAQTGDVRKALDITQRAIDLVENETRSRLQSSSQTSPARQPLGENNNLSSPASTPTKAPLASLVDLTAETAPRATLGHVVKVTSAVFNTGTRSRLQALNLQQKAVLCSLVALESRNKPSSFGNATSAADNTIGLTNDLPTPASTPNKKVRKSTMSTPKKGRDSEAPTLRTLCGAYTTLCRRENLLGNLSATEVGDVVGSLETASLVRLLDGGGGGGMPSTPSKITALQRTPSKRGRGFGGWGVGGGEERRVASLVERRELEDAVEGVGCGILRRMLTGEDLY